MTLEEAKKIVLEKENERHKNDMRIFYPDPCNENDCVQCGKAKELHEKGCDGKPFFCLRLKWKKHNELMDEAAELYAEWKVKNISSNAVLADSICLHEWDEGSHNVHKCTKCGKYNC